MKRIEFIDLAKGFCIFLVVLNHAVVLMGNPEYPLQDSLCAMRIPLYFFLSGLFFKPYENYWGFLKRKVNKLLIPFLFFRIVSCLLVSLESKSALEWNRTFDFLVGQMQAPNTPIWFLICLFWLNQIFYGIYKISMQAKHFPATIIGLSFWMGVVGYFGGGKMPEMLAPMNIGTALTAMPFFCAGYMFKSHTEILYPNRWDKYLFGIVIVCAAYTIWLAKPVSYFDNRYDSNLWITYTCGLSGVLCVLFIAKMIGYLPLVSYFGRYSIMILVTHMPILQ